MRKLLLNLFNILLSLSIAYISFRFYKKATDWKFAIAFISGAIDAFILTHIDYNFKL